MRIRSVLAAAALAALPALEAVAVTVVSEPEVGVWCSKATETKAKADAEGIPVVIVASSSGCEFCTAMGSDVLNNKDFQAWVENSGYLFCRVKVTLGNWASTEGKAVCEWIDGTRGAIPRFALYWKKKDGTLVVDAEKTNETARYHDWKYYRDKADAAFKDYKPQGREEKDDFDHGDDQKAGASDLDKDLPADGSAYEARALQSVSPLSNPPDTNDWFKLTVTEGRRYRFYLKDLALGEGAVATAEFFIGDQAAGSLPFADLAAKGFVYPDDATLVPNGDAKLYVNLKQTAGATSKYRLCYRLLEDIGLAVTPAEQTVKEDAGTAVVTVSRTGRLTDEIAFVVDTHDGTGPDGAKAGTHYTALSKKAFSIPAKQSSVTVPVTIKDIPGAQGDKWFTLSVSNTTVAAESAVPRTAKVTIQDLDVPTDKWDGPTKDDFAATATRGDVVDSTTEHGPHVLSSLDTNDWFRLVTLSAGKTYQVKALDVGVRSAGAEPSPLATFRIGSATASAATALDLASLQTTPWRFTAEASGDLYVVVSNRSVSSAVHRYTLAWQEWVLPVVTLEKAADAIVTSASAATAYKVNLTRSKNTEENVQVKVEVLSDDMRVEPSTNVVTFLAGSAAAVLSVPVAADGGYWAPDSSFTVRIIGAGAAYRLDESSIGEMTVTLKTQMPERENRAGDVDESENNDTMATAYDGFEATKRPQTEAALTLNGADRADYYHFATVKGEKYAFKFTNFGPAEGVTNGLTVTLTTLAAGTTEIPLESCVGKEYVFEAPGSEAVVGIVKPGDPDHATVKYDFTYREWVPATIGFTVDQIEISELAACVLVPVACEMEVGLPIDVIAATSNGTAVAGEDYVAVRSTVKWAEADWADGAKKVVKYVTVPLKKNTGSYEGTEEFYVNLDFAESAAQPGELTRCTVRIREADEGAVGTFAIKGCTYGEGVEQAHTSLAIPVTAGEGVKVLISRTGGMSGSVKATLKWTSGETVQVTFQEGETEKEVDLTVPSSEDVYTDRSKTSLTLTASVVSTGKAAAVDKTRKQLDFVVQCQNSTLAYTFGSDRRNVSLASEDAAWYQIGQESVGSVVRCAALAKGKKAEMLAAVTGPGVLSFDVTQTGSGALVVTGADGVLTPTVSGATYSYAIGAGVQSLTVTYAAQSAGSWVRFENVAFVPAAEYIRTGSFGGTTLFGGSVGRGQVTVGKTGRASGRIYGVGHANWTFTASVRDGVAEEIVLRGAVSSKDDITGVGLKIGEDGFWTFGLEEATVGLGSRLGWTDRPIAGVFLKHAIFLMIPSENVQPFVAELDGVAVDLRFKPDSAGNVITAGTVGGAAYSASVQPYIYRDGADGEIPAMTLILPGVGNGVTIGFVPESEGGERYQTKLVTVGE